MPRSIARLQYTVARLPFTLLDEWVVARYWERDALVRAGFERWLGSLDLVAGRLLGDDAIARRGRALLRHTGESAQAGGPGTEPPARSGRPGQVPPEPWAGDQIPEVTQAEDRAPEALPAQDQAPGILPAQDQAPEALPAQDQAPGALPAEEQAPGALPAQGQAPGVFPAEGQAPGAGPGAASRAVLQALAEQVDGNPVELFDRLASQLPGDLQTALLATEATGQPLPLDAFYQRVSDLAGVPPDQAESHTRAVVATLQEEVVGTPLEELFARLPQEYRSLLPEQPHPGEAGDFLHRVQHLGELSSREEAETATRLTLSALGDRISGGQAADLAAALPSELRPYLEQTAEPAQGFGIKEFLRRIADPQQTDPRTARRQAKAVLRTVREYTPATEVADTVAQLPPALASLLS